MKCCDCKKELENENDRVIEGWYRLFRGACVVKIICEQCKVKPENKDWYTYCSED